MSDKAAKLEKKMEIVQKLHISRKHRWSFSLTAPHCYFMWEDDCKAELTSSLKEGEICIPVAHIFAFSDVILICEASRKHTYRTRSYILLDEVTCMEKMAINGEDSFFVRSRSSDVKLVPTKDTGKLFFDNLNTFSRSREEVLPEDCK